jgi:hypothetical protein
MSRLSPTVPHDSKHIVWRFSLFLHEGTRHVNQKVDTIYKFTWQKIANMFEHKGTADGFRK